MTSRVLAWLLLAACAGPACADEWKPFESRKLGFLLQAPASWKISEGDTEVAVCRDSEFCLHVYPLPNPSSLSALELFHSIDQKESRGEADRPDYASMSQTKIGDLDAVTLKEVFAYDTYDEETFVAVGNRAFLLSFTSRMTPPYAGQYEANAAARKMVSSFRLLAPAVVGVPQAASAPSAPTVKPN